MRLVRQNDGKRAKWVGVRGGVVALAVATAASAGCADGSDKTDPGRFEGRRNAGKGDTGSRTDTGSIVLSHFRGKEDWKGTMPDMVRRFLNLVTAKGYAVARLEDYL